MYANELKAQLPKLADKMNAIVTLAKSENNRGLTSEEREKFYKLEADYTALEDSIKIAEKSASVVDELSKTPNSKITDSQVEQLRDEFRTSKHEIKDQSPHAKVYAKYLRFGMSALDSDEKRLMNFQPNFQNTMSTTTGSQGGYLVPQGFSDTLETAMKWFGGIDGVVGKFVTETGNALPWPTENDTSNKGRMLAQNTQVTETDLTFGSVTFNAWIGSSDIILVPLALIQDSYFDMDAYIAKALGTRLGRLYNYQCTNGSGSSAPTGIVTATVTAGNTVSFATGETASITYNNLVDIEGAVDPAYRQNGTWMFSDAQLKLLKKLVDGNNRPLWQPAILSSFRDGASVDVGQVKPTILDHPYIINQDVPVPAASANSILFGDMTKFMVREAGGTTVMRLTERYADYLQVGFTAFRRFDSNLLDAGTHPIAVGINSAS